MTQTRQPESRRRPYIKKRWPYKNLGELASFLFSAFPEGIHGEIMARDLGITKQTLCAKFRKDDMLLSTAERITRAYGHELRIVYPLREQYAWFTPPEPKTRFPNAKNLSGLVRYIHDSGWSIRHAGQKAGVDPNVLTRAFRKGDIKISTLKTILNNLGLVAIWKFPSIDPDRDGESNS